MTSANCTLRTANGSRPVSRQRTNTGTSRTQQISVAVYQSIAVLPKLTTCCACEPPTFGEPSVVLIVVVVPRVVVSRLAADTAGTEPCLWAKQQAISSNVLATNKYIFPMMITDSAKILVRVFHLRLSLISASGLGIVRYNDSIMYTLCLTFALSCFQQTKKKKRATYLNIHFRLR